MASVATCHVHDCEYNKNMDCLAPGGINVDMHQDHADCDTYEPGS